MHLLHAVKDLIAHLLSSKGGMTYMPYSQINQKINLNINFETVEENESVCSPRDVKRAKVARSACQAAGTPSIKDFKHELKLTLHGWTVMIISLNYHLRKVVRNS